MPACSLVLASSYPQEEVRFKGFLLTKLKPCEMPEDLASRALYDFGTGVKLIGGKAAPTPPGLPATAKALAREAEERIRLFGRDPAEALRSVPSISAEALKLLRGSDAAAKILAGELDGQLPEVALWARLSGLEQLVEAAVQRARKRAAA